MHKIRIKSEADLEKIKNLKGNDLIFLTIYNSFRPSIVSAIDLSNFGGKIVVIFVGKDYNSLIVFNPYNTPCKFLFANIGQAKVKMPYESPMSIVYHTIEHDVYVDSQQKFDNINTTFLHPKQITVHLNRDMVLDSFPSSFFSSYKGNVILTGDGNTLYIKDKKILKRLQEYCQFKYLNVELVDHIIPIYNAHDFNILRSIKKGKVVANICDDISDAKMESIFLNDFLGKMVILGNNHRLRHIKIQSFNRTHGFISSIHPTSDLKISHLQFQDVIGLHAGKCNTAGTILGKRGFVSDEVSKHFMPGAIEIINCTVSSSLLPDANVMGPFVGQSDDAMFISGCRFDSVIANSGKEVDIHNFSDTHYMVSFYPNGQSIQEDDFLSLKVRARELKK